MSDVLSRLIYETNYCVPATDSDVIHITIVGECSAFLVSRSEPTKAAGLYNSRTLAAVFSDFLSSVMVIMRVEQTMQISLGFSGVCNSRTGIYAVIVRVEHAVQRRLLLEFRC